MKNITRASAILLFIATLCLLIAWNTSSAATRGIGTNDIIVTVKYKAQPNKGAEAVAGLTQLIENVQQEPHFISIRLHVDPNDPTNILLYEAWEDADYYGSEHMNTPHLQEFIASSRNFLAGPPEIALWKMEREFK